MGVSSRVLWGAGMVGIALNLFARSDPTLKTGTASTKASRPILSVFSQRRQHLSESSMGWSSYTCESRATI